MNKQSERHEKIKKKRQKGSSLRQPTVSATTLSFFMCDNGEREDTKDYRERELSSKVS